MKIRERIATGRFARWMSKREWGYGAITLPDFRGGAVITFWMRRDDDIAAHEYEIHVPQIARLGGVRYLVTYGAIFAWLSIRHWSFAKAYELHPMEATMPDPG